MQADMPLVPLATLVNASLPPSSPKSEGSKPAILSEGKRRFFVCHGGPPVSKDGVTLDEIAKIERFGRQPGQEGIMCEVCFLFRICLHGIVAHFLQMLWTDPQVQVGRGPSKRGVGLGFGPDVTRRWCELNNVTAVIRSHEVRADGYAVEHDGLCITVFSCPNYCDSTGNKVHSFLFVHVEWNTTDVRINRLLTSECKRMEHYRTTNLTLCLIPMSSLWRTALVSARWASNHHTMSKVRFPIYLAFAYAFPVRHLYCFFRRWKVNSA